MLALVNTFTFIPRKSHENPPNKLIETKCITDFLPVFNNKAIFDFIEKTLRRIDIKYKKDKKTKSCNPQKYLRPYLIEASQQGVQNEKFFINW